jgi:hypothetical protein
MKGLVLTILLAVLELVAVNSSNDKLFADEAPSLSAIRREEVQSEVLVDAERPELAAPAPQAHAEAI